MKIKYVFAATFVLLAISGVYVLGQEAEEKQLQEGNEPFTPTKSQWLAMELNSLYSRNMLHGDRIKIQFFSSNNVIIIYGEYPRDIDRELLNLEIEHAKAAVVGHAKIHGWDGWVRVMEKVEMQKRKEQ